MSGRQQALSVKLYAPIWSDWAGTAAEDDIGNNLSAYGHELGATGGYLSAEFEIADLQGRVERWLDYIGYHVAVADDSLGTVFEGFVNEVEIRIGGLTVRRGPLLDVKNKVAVTYQAVTYNTNPPIGGGQATTAYASNTTSQAKYGVLEGVVSGGTGLAAEMEQLRDTFLAENASPATSQSINDSQAPPSVKVACRGYYDLLNCHYYSSTDTGTDNVSDKIADILKDAPSVAYARRIATNTLQVPTHSDGKNTAAGEIADMVAKGDASDNRYLFGVYAGQTAVYAAAPTTVGYHMAINENEVVITDGAGRVMPWNVLPGRWLMVDGILVGQAETADLADDPRAIFIESVRFTYPVGIQINGGKTGKLAQKLAKLGLGGM